MRTQKKAKKVIVFINERMATLQQAYIEKGIDIKIAVDMINLGLRKEYDTAVLVSTDSDFVPLITYLQSINIKVQVAAFQDDSHSCFDLKNHSKSFINLHHIIPSVLRKQKSRPKDDSF